MADAVRTGKVVKVEVPTGSGPYKLDVLLDGKNSPNKVAAWPTTGTREDPKDNPAISVQVGDYGTFTGYTKEEEYEGNKFTRFYATDFKPLDAPIPSADGSSGNGTVSKGFGLLGPRERAVECAKENINHLISIGALKDVEDIPAFIHELTNHYASAVAGE